MQTPIDIDDDIPQGRSNAPYEKAWMEALTGQQILTMMLPDPVDAKAEKLVLQQVQGCKVFSINDILECKVIPSSNDIGDAMLAMERDGKLSRGPHEGWILFKGFGLVTLPGVLTMKRIHRVIAFARNLRLLDRWLTREVEAASDEWTHRNLFQTPGIMHHDFSPCIPVSTNINDLFTLRDEEWLTGSLLESVTDMFIIQHGNTSQFMILPTHVPSSWSNTKDDKDPCWRFRERDVAELLTCAQTRPDVRIFAIVNTGAHWGVLCVNLTSKTIQFGDSLDRGMKPRLGDSMLKHVRRWLRFCHVEAAGWEFKHLDVPQQPTGQSGSCGITALNTIERCLDPTVERWVHRRSAYHRLRYLALLTRPFHVTSRHCLWINTYRGL